MADAAALVEASGSRFNDLELIGRGSFGDVYKGMLLSEHYSTNGLYTTLNTFLDMSLTLRTGYVAEATIGPFFSPGMTTIHVLVSELNNFDAK
ncbi:unnamed protein product [Ilex paraguariensis]|uniref:Uncharacterized protein n=1 Tax=Ilex paraguariensis TaxID=185542 RepID=A0ABC8UPP1_9AQUA